MIDEQHFAGIHHLTAAGERLHAVGLEQAGDTAGQLGDHAGLALLHLGQVEFDLARLDAVIGELVVRAIVELTGLEQRLRGDATRVQAGTTQRRFVVEVQPFVDTGDVHAQLCRANGRDIAGRTCADNDDIEFLAHAFPCNYVWRLRLWA